MSINVIPNTILGAGAAFIAMRTHQLVEESKANGKVYVDKATIFYSGLMLMSAALWPILWDCVVGYDRLFKMPILLLSLFWVPAVIIFDVATAGQKRAQEHRDMSVPSSQPVPPAADLRASITTLISGSFSIGILMFNSRKAHETTRLIMFGLLLLIGIVLPSFHVPADPMGTLAVRILQLVMFHFAIGLLITGIIFGLLTPPETPGGTNSSAPNRNPFMPSADGKDRNIEGGNWRVGQGGLFCASEGT